MTMAIGRNPWRMTFAGKWNPIASNRLLRLGIRAAAWQRSGFRDQTRAPIPVVAKQVEDQLAGDEVEHDRRDHFVDVAGDLEHGGDRGPGHRHEHGDDEDRGDVEGRRQPPRADPESESGGEQGCELVLAVDSDVEQAHDEPDRHGDTGDVVRHGAIDDGDDRGGAVDRLPHLQERRAWALTGDQQRYRRHGDGDNGGEHRGGHPVEQLATHACSPCVSAPVM